MEINQEDFDTIDKLCTKFSHNHYYQFPGYEQSDIYQEAWGICLQYISEYDSTKGTTLKTFLYQVLHCRLYNLKRNKFERPGTLSKDKRKINNPESLDIDMSYEDNVIETLDLINTIDENIPRELRTAWNKMKEGVHVPKVQKQNVIDIIHEVCGDAYDSTT